MNKHGLPSDSVSVATDWLDYPEFHNWQREIKKLGLAGVLRRGASNQLQIAHDDWCGAYQNARCDCRPQIFDTDSKKVLNANSDHRPIEKTQRVRPPRIYKGVDGYHLWRPAFRGDTPIYPDVQKTLREVGHLAQLRNWDTPLFFIDGKLVEALKHTDPPNNGIDWHSFRLPYESAVFVMPRLPVVEFAGFHVARIEYSRFTDNITEIVDGFDVHLFNPMEDCLTIHADKDGPSSPAALIANLCYVMNARPEYVEYGQRTGTHKKSGSELWTPNIIGRKYATRRAAEAISGTHASPRMHWRRGHFRHQPFGHELKQTKVIWIEPMLING